MTANTQTATRNQAEVGYETSKFALGVGIASAAMIGLWATACMASALLSNGLGGTVKALFTAITG
ncbi:MAG TPA: hypothetical protein EYG88_12220 [Desulfocapsa sulfexigens]|nr:hypothetical protein [Desulfocapsa sulfexigens]